MALEIILGLIFRENFMTNQAENLCSFKSCYHSGKQQFIYLKYEKNSCIKQKKPSNWIAFFNRFMKVKP